MSNQPSTINEWLTYIHELSEKCRREGYNYWPRLHVRFYKSLNEPGHLCYEDIEICLMTEELTPEFKRFIEKVYVQQLIKEGYLQEEYYTLYDGDTVTNLSPTINSSSIYTYSSEHKNFTGSYGAVKLDIDKLWKKVNGSWYRVVYVKK